MKKKKNYEAPTIQVVNLEKQAPLVCGSGLGNPGDYPGGGDPFGF